MANENQFEVLKLLAEIERDELSYRRRREMQIFTGTAALFLAVTGAVFLPRSPDDTFIIGHGLPMQVVATCAIIAIMVFSIVWQGREWEDATHHQQALTKIFRALRCFETGAFPQSSDQPLFSDKRATWGQDYSSWSMRLGTPGKISATVLLALIAVVSIWVG